MPASQPANNAAHHKALSDAIESGDLPAVQSLIGQYPELANHPGWTPPAIHCAVLWDQPEIAAWLLDHGAGVETLDPDRQTTPLRYAVMYARPRLIPLLLSHGANAGPLVEGGTSALQLAQEAADGGFEEYDDLPPREAYQEVIAVLKQAAQ